MSSPIDAPNDLIRVGEDAVRKYLRGTKNLQKQVEPMAIGLAEARKRYLADRDFGFFLQESSYGEVGKSDRAALIKLGENWSDELRERIAALPLSSPRLIAEELFPVSHPGKPDDVADDDEDDDSGYYGAPRVNRSNEAWDTLDERLVKVLLSVLPGLRLRPIWEPAAGKGLMVEQLMKAGCAMPIATDLAPRDRYVTQADFFAFTTLPEDVQAIVTNPPWGKLAAPFVRHALALAEPAQAMVAMLLPLPWITARGVSDLTGSLDTIIVPRFRARWMTPEEEAAAGGAGSPKMNHVWVVWNFGHQHEVATVVFADAPEAIAIAEAAE